ncbi:DUF7341 domain-containing protein [Microbacterium terrisoli]|jgi:hypothetical protein|uniref:DUF7341 domain-containing protein n=1 Tax=Microbacterium terrisoli TaxID=3242192 RepID=UPI002804E291|nr:hypothetical protein [Microbacterium protaetiae]
MSTDVEVLTRTHKRGIHTIDGFEVHSEPSLISQLREAIFGSGVADNSGRGHRSKLPLQAAALDLYTDIDTEITVCWAEQFELVPGPERLEQMLARWAAKIDDDTIVTVNGRDMYAKDAVKGWEQRIRDYFDPPRMAEIQSPCVSCGERYVYRWVDGENVRSSALGFRRDRDTGETLDARCAACGVVWTPAQFKFLAEQIAKTETMMGGSKL